MANRFTTPLRRGFAHASAVVLVFLSTLVVAQTNSGLEALNNGDYTTAIQQFSSEVTTAPSAAAYHNLGIAHLEAGQVGEAVWAARSSLLLGGTPTTKALLAAAEKKVPIESRGLAPQSTASTLTKIAQVGPDNLWAAFALVSFILLTFSIILGILKSTSGQFLQTASFRLATGIVGAIFLVLALVQGFHRSHDDFIAIESDRVLVSPDSSSPETGQLVEGAMVEGGEILGGYVEVRLPTGAKGWVQQESIRRIAPSLGR